MLAKKTYIDKKFVYLVYYDYNMSKIQQPTIETIKKEAKEYYKWKNMVPRYIIIWFLFILVILQFVLPRPKINFLENESKENTGITNINTEYNFEFLWKDIILSGKDIFFQINFEKSLSKILDKKNELSFVYKFQKNLLDDIWSELEKETIPSEFKYMILLEKSADSIFPTSFEAEELYELRVNEQINERLNYEKSLDVFIEHLKNLFNDFKDRDIVLIWYFMWSDDLKSLMMAQNQTNFENLYIPRDILEKYFDIMSYNYIFENITKYVDTKNIVITEQSKTSKIKIWETKDILKWSNKAGYNFKSIKELNPWILGNSLPKWKREITVVN